MNLYSLIFLLTIASFTPGPNNLLASYSGLNFGFTANYVEGQFFYNFNNKVEQGFKKSI